jgi:hypothetical protein
MARLSTNAKPTCLAARAVHNKVLCDLIFGCGGTQPLLLVNYKLLIKRLSFSDYIDLAFN